MTCRHHQVNAILAKYPVCVRPGDGNHPHSITLPDFPGCFSAADERVDIPENVQEAIKVYCEGENMTSRSRGPTPTK